ncbi:UNKNOWN [Stylonychia lemnae]|uniref:Uncharacterized protein n=1 Tax=Stylonychia lemnae TaxID=5949 RepID=A0A078ABV2_STYLE|nr:UNKNOWN [Stylonychia lemnae]|eukprot:CDW79336.1 UNKNOWN [Stylonychia lemnae]
MRPTLLMFRSPKEHTPDFYQSRVTNNGRTLLDYGLQFYDKKRGKINNMELNNSSSKVLHNQSYTSQFSAGPNAFNSTSDRFRDYQVTAQRSVVGPGQYNDQESFNKIRQKSCKTKIAMLSYGKEAGQPYYVQVGNSIMIDPTFYDQKTKKYFRQKSMKESYTVYQKDFIVQKLVDLQNQKLSQMNDSRLNTSRFMNKNSKDRPSTEMSFKKRTHSIKNTPDSRGFTKSLSKSSLVNESQKKLTLDSSRSNNKFSKIRRPSTQLQERKALGKQNSNRSNILINDGQNESYSPDVLKKKKKEILQIINQNENSLNNNNNNQLELTDNSANEHQQEKSRMIRTLVDNQQYNSQALPPSILMISGQNTSNNRQNDYITNQSSLKKHSHHTVGDLTGSASTNTTQNNFYSNSKDKRKSLLNQSQLHDNSFYQQMLQRQQDIYSSQNKGYHKKSNSLNNNGNNLIKKQLTKSHQEDQNNNISGNIQQEQINVTQRAREFDKSFQMLKMFANPYQQQQKVVLNNRASKTVRKVNSEAVNWGTYQPKPTNTEVQIQQ